MRGALYDLTVLKLEVHRCRGREPTADGDDAGLGAEAKTEAAGARGLHYETVEAGTI